MLSMLYFVQNKTNRKISHEFANCSLQQRFSQNGSRWRPITDKTHRGLLSHVAVRIISITTLQTENIPRLFSTKLQAICRTNAHLFIQNLCEHHLLKMNYGTNKVEVSYMMIWERVQAHLTTPIPWAFTDFWPFFWLFTDLSQIPWHFQISRNSRKVVNPEWLHTAYNGQLVACRNICCVM